MKPIRPNVKPASFDNFRYVAISAQYFLGHEGLNTDVKRIPVLGLRSVYYMELQYSLFVN